MRQTFPFLLLIILFSSCSEYQKALKNTDTKVKYELAEKLYNEKDFKRANRLFEQIAPRYIGKPQGQRVLFFEADTYFQIKDYNTSGFKFERFVRSYPQSEKAEQAAFLEAKSYYNLSPRYSLDQTDTDRALEKIQNFINANPNSEYLAEANLMAKELTIKKERKDFEIGKQFNKIGKFDFTFLVPAVSAMDNFITDHPGSIYREDALYYKFEASTSIAMNSFENKKQERLEEAKEAYDVLMKYFPETKYAKKANGLMEKIEKELQAK
ncbi:outer membrane protein assembly factor BamD [Spongiimicrobium salis]|uniref:outer membrane protein assembly factor BamD n=1 Tax=Spongiimicrobium salis TaxID=1667022 RepID=UPI00374D843A